jgi:hypothetical protein
MCSIRSDMQAIVDDIHPTALMARLTGIEIARRTCALATLDAEEDTP